MVEICSLFQSVMPDEWIRCRFGASGSAGHVDFAGDKSRRFAQNVGGYGIHPQRRRPPITTDRDDLPARLNPKLDVVAKSTASTVIDDLGSTDDPDVVVVPGGMVAARD